MASDRSMELLRDELLRRARGDEQENAPTDRNQILAERRRTMLRDMQTEMEPDTSRRFPRRLLLPRLALGRRRGALGDEEAALESPKTPVIQSRQTGSSPLSAPQPAHLSGEPGANGSPESMAPPYSEAQRRAGKADKKKFLFCFPYFKSRHVRMQIAQCFVAAMFLFSLLAVCKWRQCASAFYILKYTQKANMSGRFGYNANQARCHWRAEHHVDYDHSPGRSLLLLQPGPVMDSYRPRRPS
jgi:hypothetical protein